jgi:hypothetical protein
MERGGSDRKQEIRNYIDNTKAAFYYFLFLFVKLLPNKKMDTTMIPNRFVSWLIQWKNCCCAGNIAG